MSAHYRNGARQEEDRIVYFDVDGREVDEICVSYDSRDPGDEDRSRDVVVYRCIAPTCSGRLVIHTPHSVQCDECGSIFGVTLD